MLLFYLAYDILLSNFHHIFELTGGAIKNAHPWVLCDAKTMAFRAILLHFYDFRYIKAWVKATTPN